LVLLLLRLPARVEFSETLRFVQDRVIDLHAINHFKRAASCACSTAAAATCHVGDRLLGLLSN